MLALNENEKRRVTIAAIGSLVVAFAVAAIVTGESTAVAKTETPPLGSPEVTRAFDEITVHVEQKPLPPGYTTAVAVERTPTTVTRTVTRTVRYRADSWWTRGPVRRALSFPFRVGLFRRWR